MSYDIIDIDPDQKAAVVPAIKIQCSSCMWNHTGEVYVDPNTNDLLWNDTMYQMSRHYKDTEIRRRVSDNSELVDALGHRDYTLFEKDKEKGLLRIASNSLIGTFQLNTSSTLRALALRKEIFYK